MKILRQGCPIASARAGCGLADDRHWPRQGRARGRAVRHAVRRAFATSRAMLTPRGYPGCAEAAKGGCRAARSPARATTTTRPIRWCGSISRRCAPRPRRSRSTRSPAGPSISDAAAGLDGFDLFAEKDVAKAISDYYSANPQFIWVTDQQRQRQGASRRSACSARPTATACRRPTMPSPCRPRPPMPAMRPPAWPSWCASR